MSQSFKERIRVVTLEVMQPFLSIPNDASACELRKHLVGSHGILSLTEYQGHASSETTFRNDGNKRARNISDTLYVLRRSRSRRHRCMVREWKESTTAGKMKFEDK
eukprot:scaffold22577_cov122-Cylindrotheca_fusiformis.AAC.52